MSFLNKKSSMLLSMSILAGIAAFSPLNLTYAAETPANDTAAVDAGQTREVVVTATRTEAEVKAVPASVEVITRDDIKKLGANDVYSALRLAANVDIKPNGALGYNVQVRGMNTSHTLILVDGKRTADEDVPESQNYYSLGRISLETIERIEIVRGSASAQYGSDALGGVINIITRKSQGEPSVTVGVSTGTQLMNNYYHFDLGRQGKFSGTFDMNFAKTRKTMMGDTAQSYYYGPSQNYNFNGTYDLNDKQKLDFSLGYYTQNSESDYGSAYDPSAQYGPGLRYRKNNTDRYDYSIGLSGTTDKSNYYIRTSYSKLDKERTAYNVNMAGRPTIDSPMRTAYMQNNEYELWTLEGKNSVQVNDKHLLTYGAEYHKNTVEGSNLGENNPSKSLNSYAAYIQDEWMPSDNLLIIPSLRYDDYSEYGSKTTPKIGATYFVNDNFRFKANWGKGFKAPTVTELYGSIDHMGMFDIIGNPDLKAEESTNWDIGLEYDKDNTWSKLTYFHNDIDNLIDTKSLTPYIPGGPIPNQEYVNVKKAKISGVEFELGHKLSDKWTVKTTSNWLDAINKSEDSRLEGRAKNTTTLQLIYDDGDDYGYSGILWNEWINNMHGAASHGTSGTLEDHTYNTTNISINKKFGKGNRVYVGLDNMFDEKIPSIYVEGRIWRVGAEWTF